MAELSDAALRALLVEDAERGWRAFIDFYTPTLLALIERSGVVNRDEAMDVYVRACEHLAANECARLRRHDPARGALSAWLAVVVRHIVVDWVRSRAGRRRIFGVVRRLGPLDRRVFELYYWDERRPAEIAEMLHTSQGRSVGLTAVLESLERIHQVLSERHRRDLLSMAARSRSPAPLGVDDDRRPAEPRDQRADPELALRIKQLEAAFASALAKLPAEDAAILRLKFVQGLTHREIQRALHLDRLSDDRVKGIITRLQSLLRVAADAGAAIAPHLAFFEGRQE